MRTKRLRYIHLGVSGSSFSVLRQTFGTGTRSRWRPQSDGSNASEKLGKLVLRNSIRIVTVCVSVGAFWTLENPGSSFLFRMPAVNRLLSLRSTHSILVDMCAFGLVERPGGPYYKKRTRIIGNLPGLDALVRSCPKDHEHQHVEDNVVIDGKSVKRSKLAGVYPRSFCLALSKLVKEVLISSSTSADRRRLGSR